MNIKKCFVVTTAILSMVSSLSFSVSAAKLGDDSNYDPKASCSWVIGDDGTAIITEVTTTGKYFDIPDTIEYQPPMDETAESISVPVTGVKDYAFSMCENLEAVYVPETFKIENTGNVAFLTSSAVMDFMDNELGETATVNDVLRYVAKKANYKNGNFTDNDLAEVSVKLNKKLSLVDVSTASTVQGKIMTLLKNIDQMNLNDKLYNSLTIWISTITYDGFTLCSYKNAEEIKQYAEGRKILKMNFAELMVSEYIEGDSNGDGKFNVRDAAYVASTVAKGIVISPLENPGADYNVDGKVNVRDAAAMARALSASK